MQENFRDIWKMLERTRRSPSNVPQDKTNSFGSDTFSINFAAHCTNLTNSRQVKKFVYENIKLDIICKGSHISCNKSAHTNKCSLCLQEKRFISHHITQNRLSIMNSKSEIYGNCNCKTRFCQFTGSILGTEGSVAPETV